VGHGGGGHERVGDDDKGNVVHGVIGTRRIHAGAGDRVARLNPEHLDLEGLLSLRGVDKRVCGRAGHDV